MASLNQLLTMTTMGRSAALKVQSTKVMPECVCTINVCLCRRDPGQFAEALFARTLMPDIRYPNLLVLNGLESMYFVT